MLNRVFLHNFPTISKVDFSVRNDVFMMKTCQRTLVLSYNHNPLTQKLSDQHEFYQGTEAYQYLLKIICGLKSKLVGENEIVGQFKVAYKEYAKSEHRSNKLLTVIEKLFKDSKAIRSSYLLGLGQKTYASLTKKKFLKQKNFQHVLIIGSGQLAEDLINQFKKKATIYVTARNESRLHELSRMHDLIVVPWMDVENYKKFPYIVNTVGFEGVLLDDVTFFNEWNGIHLNKLFVDLGSPTCIKTKESESTIFLGQILDEGAVLEDHKRKQVIKANSAIKDLAVYRQETFIKKEIRPSRHVNV